MKARPVPPSHSWAKSGGPEGCGFRLNLGLGKIFDLQQILDLWQNFWPPVAGAPNYKCAYPRPASGPPPNFGPPGLQIILDLRAST